MDPTIMMASFGLAGFAVQRAIELLDPAVDWLSDDDEDARPWRRKTWLTAVIGSFLGLLAACAVDAWTLLGMADHKLAGHPLDHVLIALVLGAGSTGLNAASKYLDAVKAVRSEEAKAKSRRERNESFVEVTPREASINVGQSIELVARSAGSRTLAWKLLTKKGGKLSEGEEAASRIFSSDQPGEYIVMVRNGAASVTATITVE